MPGPYHMDIYRTWPGDAVRPIWVTVVYVMTHHHTALPCLVLLEVTLTVCYAELVLRATDQFHDTNRVTTQARSAARAVPHIPGPMRPAAQDDVQVQVHVVLIFAPVQCVAMVREHAIVRTGLLLFP